jgi:hypothetical protein
MFWVVDSKSKSNPSTMAFPKGLLNVFPDCSGPNMAQTLFAAETAAAGEVNPPSVYVAPPIESMMVFW